MQKPRLILGIDPPKGWAIVNHSPGKKSSVVAVGSVKGIDQLLPAIETMSFEYEIDLVRVEKPANRHVHPRPGVSPAAMQKIAHNVGENWVKADRIKEFCESLGLKCEFMIPIRGGTKLKKPRIKQMTGYTGQSNEHSRDALVIAWV